jgi:methylenetetrahydrofolate reductase (NADPH)
MRRSQADKAGAEAILDGFSLEMTGKDVGELALAGAAIRAGTRVDVTFLGTEDLDTRVGAARAVTELGLVPVPHVAARRLGSKDELEKFLATLQELGASEHLLVVGGDPLAPAGPYDDALAVVRSGLLQRYGAREVAVTGYPEGHPRISDDALWAALRDKLAELSGAGLAASITTQLGFDADAALRWVQAVRERGITVPIRVGVAGPAGVRRLLTYAKRFGVGTSTGIVRKYGMSVTNLLGTAGPDRFIASLAAGYRPDVHGEVLVHLYTFGGLAATSEWVRGFLEGPA